MRQVLLVVVLVLAACRGKAPADWRQVATSEAVKVLKGDDSPYRIIYSPPVDLAKQAAITTPRTQTPRAP
ncbi:MAG TPA: hypothetical protein VGJ80_09825 [Gemmatimonadales bacterium]